MAEPIITIRNLHTNFISEETEVRAVDGLNMTIETGEFTALIGESGSGKTVTALSIMRLIPYAPGIIDSGEILFKGRDLLKISDQEMKAIRGKEIAMIFQEASAALNPVIPVGKQIAETLRLHNKGMSRTAAMEQAVELLRSVGVPSPETRVREYPHQFSGGMQQRSMIAMALSCKPDLLIADEPTTALDVTVQAQVLEQLNQLHKETGASILMITHNLGIVARYADAVKIMYGGRIVEEGPTRDIFYQPHHPYTVGLIRSVPRLDRPRSAGLSTIPGDPPDMGRIPANMCPFAERCPYADEQCLAQRPEAEAVAEKHFCACFHKDRVAEDRKKVF